MPPHALTSLENREGEHGFSRAYRPESDFGFSRGKDLLEIADLTIGPSSIGSLKIKNPPCLRGENSSFVIQQLLALSEAQQVFFRVKSRPGWSRPFRPA
jgi:hypothetical protein